MKFSWIAVALATAIRLYAGPQFWPSFWTVGVVAVLAIVAWALVRGAARRATVRIAATFLLLVAIVDSVSLWRVQSLSRAFQQRLSEHLAHDLGDLRRHIGSLEAELDSSAARIAQGMAGKEQNRGALFLLVAGEAKQSGRGARILDKSGEPIAWWGEDYRA